MKHLLSFRLLLRDPNPGSITTGTLNQGDAKADLQQLSCGSESVFNVSLVVSARLLRSISCTASVCFTMTKRDCSGRCVSCQSGRVELLTGCSVYHESLVSL